MTGVRPLLPLGQVPSYVSNAADYRHGLHIKCPPHIVVSPISHWRNNGSERTLRVARFVNHQ